MKKIIFMIISILIIHNTFLSMAYAEDDIVIDGFDEHYDKIWFYADENPELVEKIKDSFAEYVDMAVAGRLKTPVSKRASAGWPVDDIEFEKKLRESSEYKLNYDIGVKAYPVITQNYTKQYASNNNLDYLISQEQYIMMMTGMSIYNGHFDLEGLYVYENSETNYRVLHGSDFFDSDTLEILSDREKIKSLIIENGETKVEDVKVVILNYNTTFLYIKCPDDVYVMQIDNPNYVTAKKLYRMSDMFDLLVEEHLSTSSIEKQKPTFDTEAVSLQNDGLLYGNEKGLDLLKPLTRIEAAAMLLRATGHGDEVSASVEAFSDVPADHWGYNVARTAQELGIVKGIGDNMFAPDRNVTGAEFSTMVLRVLGEEEFDWEKALAILVEKGIITKEDSSTMDFFTRGDMAKIIYEIRNKGLVLAMS